MLGTFKLGDLQEHRYAGQNNWVKDAVPHYVHWREENPGFIVADKFDADKKRFSTNLEYMDKLKKLTDEKEANQYQYTPKPLDPYIDDWSGTKYAKHPYTYGEEPFPQYAEPLVKYDPPKSEEEKEEKKDDKPKEKVVLWIDSDIQQSMKKHHHHKRPHHHHSYIQEDDSLLQLDSNINIDE